MFSCFLPPQRPHHAHALFDFTPPTPPSYASYVATSSSSSTAPIRCDGRAVATDTWASSPLSTSSPFTNANDLVCHSNLHPPWPRPLTLHPLLHNVWSLTSRERTAHHVTDSSLFPRDPKFFVPSSRNRLANRFHPIPQLHLSLNM